ncbi:MAG: J domain-containing protein [Candidatus Hodarchaeales archaeon]|jgi:curved DNA-binding protein CbpA
MRHNDALHILGLNNNAKMEDIKLAYRRSCAKYHPDRNPAGLEMMKLINNAYDDLQDYFETAVYDFSVQEESETENYNYGEEINEALSKIINLGLEIEVCGSWIWVSGETKQHKDILKEAGFKWAAKKQMWHFRPNDYKSCARGKWSMEQIRATHGSKKVKSKSFVQIRATA